MDLIWICLSLVKVPWSHSAQRTWQWSLFFLLLYLLHQRPETAGKSSPDLFFIHCIFIYQAELGDSMKDSPPPVLLRHSGTVGHHLVQPKHTDCWKTALTQSVNCSEDKHAQHSLFTEQLHPTLNINFNLRPFCYVWKIYSDEPEWIMVDKNDLQRCRHVGPNKLEEKRR